MEQDVKFIKYVKSAGGENVNKCFQCATCSVVCKLSPEKNAFPRRLMLHTQWGNAEKLVGDPDLWMCHQCNDCSTNCPRGAEPASVLAALRTYVYSKFSIPSFMGRALASPKALPLLLLVPIVLMLGLVFLNMALDKPVHSFFDKFISHGLLMGLFITGNVIIFAVAAFGLLRFWGALKKSYGIKEGGPGFIGAVISTILEILTNKRMNKCTENKQRNLAHLMVIWGFIGSMATAGLALFIMIIDVPLSSPGASMLGIIITKALGNVSGWAGLIGIILLMIRRKNDPNVKSDYSDWLFLWMFLVLFATGLLTQYFRFIAGNNPESALAIISFAIYFIHMVSVFFILWYVPYSKFAHMFYRTMALIYAKMAGREARE